MACPFLKEARVRYCRTAAVRKLIPTASVPTGGEKCSTAAHTTCATFEQQKGEGSADGRCPYLTESLMQYCGAAPVTRFVPYSEPVVSRCGSDGFRYCELYLAMALPGELAEEVDGIVLPPWLAYTANHLWLDVGNDGTCHAGIDGFLSRTLGKIDDITYVWQSGEHRPTAVVTVGGTDLEVVFPNHMRLTRCNLYLRADPARITAEPYTSGWLFEGVPDADTATGLLTAAEARARMDGEQHRMNQFLQEAHSREVGFPVAEDGGLFAEGVARLLDREQRLSLFHEFFSPYARGKKGL